MGYLKKAVDYLFIICGSFCVALAINLFIASNSLAFGGVSGISVIAYELLGIPLSVTNLIINIPLFLVGMKFIGKKFFIKSLFATFMVSAFLSLTNALIFIQIDLILSGIFGGILLGTGVGIVVKVGGSTGGTDMAALILNKQLKVPISFNIFAIDSSVILLGTYFFGMNNALYSLIVVFCLSRAVGFTVTHFDTIINRVITPFRKTASLIDGA